MGSRNPHHLKDTPSLQLEAAAQGQPCSVNARPLESPLTRRFTPQTVSLESCFVKAKLHLAYIYSGDHYVKKKPAELENLPHSFTFM